MTGLVFCLADSDTYKLPMFSPSEVFLSPDVIKPQRGKTYRIPRGSPHMESLYRLYPELPLRPDYVFIKTDALAHNFVRGVSSLGCPSFISIADTHHLHRPIERIVDYLSSERFTIISAENDRHHLKWYGRKGFTNLSWHPNIALNPDIHEPVTIEESIRRVCFIGSLGRFHPYRRFIVERLSECVHDFDHGQIVQSKASLMYNRYLISLNISLNSDLNWRFFEVLAAGGFLLTDRLPRTSGISEFLEEGVHYEAFSTFEELRRKIEYYLRNPEEAKLIGIEGHKEYLRSLQPKVLKKRMFAELFGIGSRDKSIDNILELSRIDSPISVRAYQSLQEIHRISIEVVVYSIGDLYRHSLLQNELEDFSRITVICIDHGTEHRKMYEQRDAVDENQFGATSVVYFDSKTTLHELELAINSIRPEYIVADDHRLSESYGHLANVYGYEYSESIDCYVVRKNDIAYH